MYAFCRDAGYQYVLVVSDSVVLVACLAALPPQEIMAPSCSGMNVYGARLWCEFLFGGKRFGVLFVFVLSYVENDLVGPNGGS